MSFREGLHHLGRDPLAGVRPGVEDLVVPLLVGDDPALVQLVVLDDLLLGLGDDGVLGQRGLEVVGGERQARPGRLAEAQVLHPVQQRDRLAAAEDLVAVGDDALELLLAEGQVVERHLRVEDVVEDHPPHGGPDDHARAENSFSPSPRELLVRRQAQLDHARGPPTLPWLWARKTSLGRENDHAVAGLARPPARRGRPSGSTTP